MIVCQSQCQLSRKLHHYLIKADFQTIFDNMMSKFLFTLFLSILLVSCSSGGSINSQTSQSSVVSSNDGSTVTTADGVVIRVNADGVPTIVSDPNGRAKITTNSDGSSTITTGGGSTVTVSPDGSSITNQSSNSNVIINGNDR
ncbi:MAG: hypothetical protein QNJ34_28270 [Xenococcaceae cyanobacterium MO_188.B29]|nr:hypothetical protein [Xenococcaceae cyanobacterium MO_188.B29]